MEGPGANGAMDPRDKPEGDDRKSRKERAEI
jgi:hypothetical protein